MNREASPTSNEEGIPQPLGRFQFVVPSGFEIDDAEFEWNYVAIEEFRWPPDTMPDDLFRERTRQYEDDPATEVLQVSDPRIPLEAGVLFRRTDDPLYAHWLFLGRYEEVGVWFRRSGSDEYVEEMQHAVTTLAARYRPFSNGGTAAGFA